MKKFLSFALGITLILLSSLFVINQSNAWRGSYEMVTVTSTDVTSTVTEIDGSELARNQCIISNPDANFDLYVAPGSNTYSARYYFRIPPGDILVIPAHNISGTYLTNNKFYAKVSPTPHTTSVGFISVKSANPDPTD